jgi:hypothetical protein
MGFASGEACFIVDIAKSNSNKIGSGYASKFKNHDFSTR